MASYPADPLPLGYPSSNLHEHVDAESEDDQVDQLESDSDVEVSDPEAMSSFMKNSRQDERLPGHTVLPSVRLENIIQADGVTGNLALSKEGLFVLSVATEEFVKRMAQAGWRQASSEGRSAVKYRDMALSTQQYQEFMFLHDTIPSPLTLAEALAKREAKEKELLDEDPALAGSISALASTSIAGPSTAPKSKAKSRPTNGQTNGSASTSRRERRIDRGQWVHNDPREGDEGPWVEWAEDQGSQHPRSGNNGGAFISAARPPLVNGRSHSPSASHSGTLTPALSRDERMEPPSPPSHPHPHSIGPEDNWPGQFTGPASGFLQGPGGPFSRVAQNPGRTIYSHQHRAD